MRKSKREFLKSLGSAGVFLAGANLPVWAINISANECDVKRENIKTRKTYRDSFFI